MSALPKRKEEGHSRTGPRRVVKDVRVGTDYIKIKDTIRVPATRGTISLGEKTGVVVDKEEWDDLVERLEDLEALKVFEKMKDEPPEAFVSVAEVKRRLWTNNIKEARKGKGVTQVELARRLGCKQSYISKLEHPDYRPEVSTLERVAEALGVEVTELIWRGRRIVSMAKKPRDTYKYQFKIGNKIVHGGITDDLERREGEHQKKWPKGHIKQVGRRTTEEAARDWEEEKGYS